MAANGSNIQARFRFCFHRPLGHGFDGADVEFPVCFARSEALVESEKLVDDENDSITVWWSDELWISPRKIANLHAVVEIKQQQSLGS